MHALQAVCMYMKVFSTLVSKYDVDASKHDVCMFLLSGSTPALKDLCFEILLHVHAYICMYQISDLASLEQSSEEDTAASNLTYFAHHPA